MIDNKNYLNSLIEERNALKEKHNRSFKTKSEIENYIRENQVELSRLKFLQNEIEMLKFEAMTPEEKKAYLEFMQKLKEKYADD